MGLGGATRGGRRENTCAKHDGAGATRAASSPSRSSLERPHSFARGIRAGLAVDERAIRLSATIGAYRVDAQSFNDGLQFFRHDQFLEARGAFGRADPAERDALTQFYIAYSYYREGWGRLYSDDALFAKGLESVNKAMAVVKAIEAVENGLE